MLAADVLVLAAAAALLWPALPVRWQPDPIGFFLMNGVFDYT